MKTAWAAPDFDDSAWPSVTPSGSWKNSGLTGFKDFDGVAWYRATVTLTEAQASAANALRLGPVDTSDTTWVNGVRVGGANIPWIWREYAVPAGLFRPGRNVIALRVLSGGQGGGLSGPPDQRSIATADGQQIALPAAWKVQRGSALRGLSVPSAPWDWPNSLITLYNGMIAPLVGYRFKLVAWYQGEANADAATEYRSLLPLLMRDWRERFGQPELPFLVTQLTSFGDAPRAPGKSGWAELRAAQAEAVAHDAHAALAVTLDLGDRFDIHPPQKTIVGERLARAARAMAYAEPAAPGSPYPVSAKRSGKDSVAAIDVDLTAEHLKLRKDAPITLTDLWSKTDTTFTNETKLRVAPRETRIFRVQGARELAHGLYLSEQPGSVNPAVDGVTQPQPAPTLFRSSAAWSGTKGPAERPMYAGWGGARADSTPYGQILQIAGTPYAAGIGILANSRLEVRNHGYRHITTRVGVDDSAQDRKHAVTFMIYGDGKLLAKSKALRWGQPAQARDADVSGVKSIELVARSATPGNAQQPVTWGDAALLSSAQPE